MVFSFSWFGMRAEMHVRSKRKCIYSCCTVLWNDAKKKKQIFHDCDCIKRRRLEWSFYLFFSLQIVSITSHIFIKFNLSQSFVVVALFCQFQLGLCAYQNMRMLHTHQIVGKKRTGDCSSGSIENSWLNLRHKQ